MLKALETLRQNLPEFARDTQENLEAVLTDTSLSVDQRLGVAVASAIASGNTILRDATLADAKAVVAPGVIEDAAAAATLMAMTNVYYRFRHMIGKPGYSAKAPRLRMGRMKQPLTTKIDMDLFALAVSAINGCEGCIKAHEKGILEGGLTEDHVNDAVRIASVFQAAAAALDSGI